jgi:uncharacterized protein DUF4166
MTQHLHVARPTSLSHASGAGPSLSAPQGRRGLGRGGAGAPAWQADPSFRHLLGELAWRRLAPAVRARFAVKPAPGRDIRYVGAMRVVRCSAIGWVMARLCRLVGTPIAPHTGSDVPVRVSLRLAADGHGVVWERLYDFPGRAPVRCVSVKRATADGIIASAAVSACGSRSQSKTARFISGVPATSGAALACLCACRCGSRRAMHVAHIDLGGGRFRFQIDVHHPLFGETFHQDGVFTREGGEPWIACSC